MTTHRKSRYTPSPYPDDPHWVDPKEALDVNAAPAPGTARHPGSRRRTTVPPPVGGEGGEGSDGGGQGGGESGQG